MANTLSVMLRNIVSKKRRRYTEGGFNLDLAYICHNIIAMGYPGENIQSVFRNPMNDVCHFFEVTHPEHYKVYNLRSEKAYDVNKFHGRVSVYAFEDHNPPTIELIGKFCNDVDRWLNADEDNVAAIHCKAGKGRTGTMICCYLLYSGVKTTAEDALAYYGEKRTMNKKGVTIPSQRRYVQYYARLIQRKLKYERRTLQLCEIRFSPAPILQSQGSVQCLISTMEEIDCTETRTSKVHDPAGSWTKVTVKELDKFTIDFRKTFKLELDDQHVFVTGDVKVELKKYFHFWFNTYFIRDADFEGEGEDMKLIFTLPKWELDDAHKDKEHKLFSEDFEVQLVLRRFPLHSRNNVDGTEIAQLRQHNHHNNHVNSLTHNSHNNANMLLTHGAAIPTSSNSGDPSFDASNFIQHPVERSRKPTSLPPFSPLGGGGVGGGGIAGASSHMPLISMQNLMQRHHQQQKRSSEPTPSVNPESINRSNNKNHNNSSHHQQQQQQQQQMQPQQPTHHHHHHQHHLHQEQQKLMQKHSNQQQLQSQQQNNKCSTSSSNIHNTSSNSNSSSSSSISSQSTSSSSSAGGGGGGGGGGGVGEEEEWESGESSTTTTTTSTTTTTPTTTSYFPYKRLISSQNDDDDDDSNKNNKNDDDDDDNGGVGLINSPDSTTKLSIATATITTTTTTTTITTTTTTTTTTINSSKYPPTTGVVDISENTNTYSPPCSRPMTSSVNTAPDDGFHIGILPNAIGNNISDHLPLPIPLPPPQTNSSTNGLHQNAYSSPIKPVHMNFFHRKCSSEAPCIDSSSNQKASATTKCTSARSKFLKLINSQRFKAKNIGPTLGSSLALNSSGAVTTSTVTQNQLLKKKKVKSKKIPPSKTIEWLHSYFQKDPEFDKNLSQQTTIPMGRRNSAGSISSRHHLNSVGSASGIGRAGSVEKGFRVGSIESKGPPGGMSDDEENCHFVGLHKPVPKNLPEKSSGAVKKLRENSIFKVLIPTENSFVIEDKQRRKCNFSVEDTISMSKPHAFNKSSSDFTLSLGTSPVDRALRNVVDVGTQLNSISPARDKEFTYESDSDHSMSQSNAAALLTKNNFRPGPLDISNCDAKSLDVATCLPLVALGKLSPPSNKRTTSIGSSNNSTSMDHLCVPYSNMYLQTQSTQDDVSGSVDTEVYHDHDDYYSSICDNQLSFNNSPCKSPRSLSDMLDLKPAITHRILLRQADGSSPNAKATANASAAVAATVANSRKNTTSSDGIVIAKPVESHSIGFNVELTSPMTSSPQTTENYNMDVDCDDDDAARRKSPVDSILSLEYNKSDYKPGAVSAISVIDGVAPGGEVGDYIDCDTVDVSLNNPKAGLSSTNNSCYCCTSEGSQSVSSTSLGVLDSSSGTGFSLERNSLDAGRNSGMVINSKKKLSLPTPEIEVAEFGITKNRSSSVSNNNNHSNISSLLASPLLSSSSSSGSSIDNNDKH